MTDQLPLFAAIAVACASFVALIVVNFKHSSTPPFLRSGYRYRRLGWMGIISSSAMVLAIFIAIMFAMK